jgi:hypothetical protein
VSPGGGWVGAEGQVVGDLGEEVGEGAGEGIGYEGQCVLGWTAGA